MSYSLPLTGTPARELFDVADLVAVGLGEVPVASEIWRLRRQAAEIFSASPAAKRVAFFRANPSTDDLELVSFGSRGGWRREWNFGPAGRRVRLM